MPSAKYAPAEWVEPSSIREARQYQAHLLEEALNIQSQLLASNARDRSGDPEHLEWRRRATSAYTFRQQLIARYNCWILDQPMSSVDTTRNKLLSDAIYLLDLMGDIDATEEEKDTATETAVRSLDDYRAACEVQLSPIDDLVYIDTSSVAV